jgi:hypothetical protein
MHQFNAGDHDRCIPEFLEPEHHSDTLLHASMILLNQIFKYFDERNLVSAGSKPSPSTRAPLGERQHTHPA